MIQTLRVNDHRCVFLTNQQAEENSRLSTVFARSRDYPSGKFAPKRKSDKRSTDAEEVNKRSDRVDLRGQFFDSFCRSVNLACLHLKSRAFLKLTCKQNVKIGKNEGKLPNVFSINVFGNCVAMIIMTEVIL